MNKYLLCSLLCVLFTGVAYGNASEKPFVHSLFTDNAVIQRDIQAPIWGWTAPDSKVNVALVKPNGDTSTYTTTSDNNGKWIVKVGPFPAGGPYTLKVTGPGTFEAKNVMFGDVWICSGQSNMAMGIADCKDGKKEIAAANYPNIRIMAVPKLTALKPQEYFKSTWYTCSPESLMNYKPNGFSGVAYFFGRELSKELNVPIGLIRTAWSATIAEAWTSQEALASDKHFAPLAKQIDQMSEQVNTPGYDYDALVQNWWKQQNSNWASMQLNDNDWKRMKLPNCWEKAGLPGFNGLVYFRKDVVIPKELEGKKAVLSLGRIDDLDVTYMNGIRVGATNDFRQRRIYNIPMGILKAGNNVIAVGVLDKGNFGGILDMPNQMNLTIGKEKFPIAGEWKYKASRPYKDLSNFPKQILGNPNIPSAIYNGMIATLSPLAIKGAIWYQGESNADHPDEYRILLPLMIKNWRNCFTSADDGKFPFGIVVLAGYRRAIQAPVQEGWASLREAQILTGISMPNTGLASAVDIGEAYNIHPKNKQEVGRRLALWMLGTAYGKNIVYSGPIYKSMKIEGNVARITFDHIGGGLVTKDGNLLQGFAIRGKTGEFVSAKAEIDGNTVVVSAKGLNAPVAVRYAWANNPESANLYNKEGLPALPFRTDMPAIQPVLNMK